MDARSGDTKEPSRRDQATVAETSLWRRLSLDGLVVGQRHWILFRV